MGRIGSMVGVFALFAACGAPPAPIVEEAAEAEAPLTVELRDNRIVYNHAIRFSSDTNELLPDSLVVLDRVAELLATHPNLIRVQVQGHTDTHGAARHNRELSERRATAVAGYLRGAGVEQEVTAQGFGETYPLCQDESDECGERNRRVEFFVDER